MEICDANVLMQLVTEENSIAMSTFACWFMQAYVMKCVFQSSNTKCKLMKLANWDLKTACAKLMFMALCLLEMHGNEF